MIAHDHGMKIDAGTDAKTTGPFERIADRMSSNNSQLGEASVQLRNIIDRLEGPKPSEAAAGEPRTEQVSILAGIDSRLDDTTSLVTAVGQLVNQLDKIVR